MLVQSLALLVVIGLTIPSYLDFLFRPLGCQSCWDFRGYWDFRGFWFILAALFLGPPALLLLATYWLWRRPRRWPAVLPLLVDVAIIGTVLIELVGYIQTRSLEPMIVVATTQALSRELVVPAVLGMVLPAVVSLALILALLWRWDSGKPTPRSVSVPG